MRLLIADPDLHACRSARLLLSHAGHEVVGATTSAPAAAALARDATPDLCLVDASLAAGRTEDGLRVAEIIWTESGAPLLLLVGAGFAPMPGPETLARLARPFGALELLEAVQVCETLLRREPPPARVDRLTRLTLFDQPQASLPQ
jgi:DNA-binding response OmpR family regulator